MPDMIPSILRIDGMTRSVLAVSLLIPLAAGEGSSTLGTFVDTPDLGRSTPVTDLTGIHGAVRDTPPR